MSNFHHFSLHIILVKFGEQPVHMETRVLDSYMSIVYDVARTMARSYLAKGWRIDKLECRDFEFTEYNDSLWKER